MMITDRRALLGAFAFAPIAAGAMASSSNPASAIGDARIEAAWRRRLEAFHAYDALPLNVVSVAGGYAPEERELWDIIDAAEEEIRAAVAITPRGVMLQICCALHHVLTDREDEDALRRVDVAAFDQGDGNLEWHARLLLAACRSLQAMEA